MYSCKYINENMQNEKYFFDHCNEFEYKVKMHYWNTNTFI